MLLGEQPLRSGVEGDRKIANHLLMLSVIAPALAMLHRLEAYRAHSCWLARRGKRRNSSCPMPPHDGGGLHKSSEKATQQPACDRFGITLEGELTWTRRRMMLTPPDSGCDRPRLRKHRKQSHPPPRPRNDIVSRRINVGVSYSVPRRPRNPINLGR
jgi:hypothetical protein